MFRMRSSVAAITLLAAGAVAYGGPVLLPADNNDCLLNAQPCSGGAGHNANSAVSFFLGPAGLSFQGTGGLTEFTTGVVASAIPAGTMIPFSYDFTLISEGEGSSTPTWALTMEITDGSIVWTDTVNGSYGPSLLEFTDSGSVPTTAAIGAGDTVSVAFNLDMTNTAGILTVVHIPAEASVDIGPAPGSAAAVPEPSMGGMLGGCLLVLAFRKYAR